jgi:hypothetical protein
LGCLNTTLGSFKGTDGSFQNAVDAAARHVHPTPAWCDLTCQKGRRWTSR